MNLYNIFDTQEEAIEAEALDYQALRNHFALNPEYLSHTLRWAVPIQRLDGKWVYQQCTYSEAVYKIEEYDPNWFPQVEE